MNKAIGILFIISIPVLIFLYVQNQQSAGGVGILGGEAKQPLVTIGDVPIRVEVANTPETRSQGLSRRSHLGPTNGMLFVFDELDYHGIWMKDMLISIDVIWIDESFRVVDITESLQPKSYPKVFEPRIPARFAIETNVNYASTFGINIGDEVSFPEYLIPDDLQL